MRRRGLDTHPKWNIFFLKKRLAANPIRTRSTQIFATAVDDGGFAGTRDFSREWLNMLHWAVVAVGQRKWSTVNYSNLS